MSIEVLVSSIQAGARWKAKYIKNPLTFQNV